MITLTEITDPLLLNKYHVFRAKVYRESPVSGFLKHPYFDRDKYDAHSSHFGWYVEGELSGSIRFIHPTPFTHTLYSLGLLPVKMRSKALDYLQCCFNERNAIVELSRICVASGSRSRENVRQFSLAIIEKLIELKIDHALFTAFGSHRKHWEKYGCKTLRENEGWVCNEIGETCYCMIYEKSSIPNEVWSQLANRNNQLPAA